jgi:hypothetical protein
MGFSFLYLWPLCGSQPEAPLASRTYSAVAFHKTMVKVLPHVIRSINELNIPAGTTDGFEILYFGVNLLLMFDYRLSFYIEVKPSDNRHQIELFIIRRKDVSSWKNNAVMKGEEMTANFNIHYRNIGQKINGVFRPQESDAYAFILSNRSYIDAGTELGTQTVMVTLTHSWEQEIKESQLKDRL